MEVERLTNSSNDKRNINGYLHCNLDDEKSLCRGYYWYINSASLKEELLVFSLIKISVALRFLRS